MSGENLSNSTKVVKVDATKEQIRLLVSGIYDLQKLRISAGNRLVQSFYQSLGIKPSESPDNAEKAEKSMIDKLKGEYTRISDALVVTEKPGKEGKTKTTTVKTAIKKLNQSKEKEDNLEFVRDETDYKMIESYILLLQSEEESIKALEKIVKKHPMWDAFFSKVKGCGTLMSAMCIAYLDPYKADHASSFFKYAGLDVVQDKDSQDRFIFLALDADKRKVYHEAETDSYFFVDTNERYIGDVVPSTHGRRMGDTAMVTYYIVDENGNRVLATNEDGTPKYKKSITYNPKLKTKLMGVLTGCLLKAKDPVYSKLYYDQRNRLANSSFHKNKSAAQHNMMAQRYMIKEFLRSMWETWRTLEGLPVDEPYAVAKLGMEPHHYSTEAPRYENA